MGPFASHPLGNSQSTDASYHPKVVELVHLADQLESDGHTLQAIQTYRKALRKDATYFPVYLKLGELYFRLADYENAITHYHSGLKVFPQSCEFFYLLGNCFLAQGDDSKALQYYREAISLNPRFTPPHNELARLHQKRGEFKQALQTFENSLALNPGQADAYTGIAALYARQGKIRDAIRCVRQALKNQPDHPQIHSNLLFYVNLDPSFDNEQIFSEYQDWSRRHAAPLSPYTNYDNTPDVHREIKIAFVSPDFRDHVVSYLIEPFILHHSRKNFQVVCYFTSPHSDHRTHFFRENAFQWREVYGLTDQQFAERIREDGIDILVDLSGHMAGNRLLTFALKPAPVQITQTGYPNTTGLLAMDYRITDRYLDPPGLTSPYHTEKLIHLDGPALVYNPLRSAPEPQPPPSFKRGHLTFGSFNNFCKVSDPCVAVWSNILNRFENSALVILIPGGDANAEAVFERFAPHGIDPSRIKLFDLRSRREYLDLHHEVDIALDAFPYTGAFTTMESLWMGVPVVSLAGLYPGARHGVSVLTYINHPEWIAYSEEDYIDKVVALAEDPDSLKRHRCQLRQDMRESPLLDASRHARELAMAYQMAWTSWCEAQGGMGKSAHNG